MAKAKDETSVDDESVTNAGEATEAGTETDSSDQDDTDQTTESTGSDESPEADDAMPERDPEEGDDTGDAEDKGDVEDLGDAEQDADDTETSGTSDTASDTGAEDETASGTDSDTDFGTEADPSETDAEATGEADSATPEDTAEEASADLANADQDDAVEATASETSAQADAPAPQPQVIRETVVQRKAGFFPMALGGVVAAALGFGAAQYDLLDLGGAQENPFEAETRAALSAQGEEIDVLTSGASEVGDRISALQGAIDGIDLGPLDSRLAGLEETLAGMDARITGLGDDLAALDSRLTALEKQPLAEAVSPEAIAAYERELEALRGQIATQAETLQAQEDALTAKISDQQSTLESAIASQQSALESEAAALYAEIETQKTEMQAIIDEARAMEDSAEEKAVLAASRNALAEVIAKAQNGEPFAEPLGILTGNDVAVPASLVDTAEDGIPSLVELTESFPDAARAALATARATAAPAAEGESSGGGGLGGFFTSQLGARSVVPREGNDPDAVLSRAEAAVKGGDLETAMTEITALPEAAQSELSDWVALATLRRDALAAASALAQELNTQ